MNTMPGRFLFVPIFCVVLILPSYAMEEFFTTPGTRAMGMGGAFVAQATDSSALWYNPAGLGFSKGIDVTLDYGDVVAAKGHDDGSISADGYYTSEKEIKYLAYNMWGFGMAYFRPYNFYAGANNMQPGGGVEFRAVRAPVGVRRFFSSDFLNVLVRRGNRNW